MSNNNLGKNTSCVHTINDNSPIPNGVNTPIYTSTAFEYPNKEDEVYYPRYFNLPNHNVVANKIALLENAEKGLVLSSGMAAITTVFFSYLKPGDHAIIQRNVYGGTSAFITGELKDFNIETTFIDSNDVKDFESSIKKNTKLIYIETPSNPLLKVIDIKKIADLAKSKNLLSVIDNTFASPINQNPINLGIDIVIHSGTKYLNGHSDINCGAIATSNKLMSKIYSYSKNHGGTLDSHACYMLERGLKTMGIRVAKQNTNAEAIAKYLEENSNVQTVNYPGLTSSPDYEIAKKQMKGFGGMLSFEIKGSYDTAKTFLNNLEIILPAVSLGGIESLATMPRDTSHARMSDEERKEAGISDTLVRISSGIEDVEDLINDLEKAFSKVKSKVSA